MHWKRDASPESYGAGAWRQINNAIKQYENDPESLKEFLDIKEETNKHHAGLTIVASAIMNLDEFLTHA